MGSYAETKIRTLIENIKDKRAITEEDNKFINDLYYAILPYVRNVATIMQKCNK